MAMGKPGRRVGDRICGEALENKRTTRPPGNRGGELARRPGLRRRRPAASTGATADELGGGICRVAQLTRSLRLVQLCDKEYLGFFSARGTETYE